MTIERNDLGIGRISKELDKLGKLEIFLGVQGEEAAAPHPNADDATVGQVAHWMYFGTDKIPARPWIDVAISSLNQGTTDRFMQKAVSDLIDGRQKDAVASLVPLGEAGAKELVIAIDTARRWAEDLAESTSRKKGHSQPLLDTGTLRDAQSYTIRQGDRVLEGGKAP